MTSSEPEGRIIGQDAEGITEEGAIKRLNELTDRFKKLTGQDTEERPETTLAREIVELTDRIKRLEDQTQFETSEDDARLRVLERRVKLLEEATPRPEEWARSNQVLNRITALENGSRLVGTGGLIASLVDRLERLEKGSVVVGTEAARLIPTEQIRRAEREFSSGSHGPDVLHMSNQDQERVGRQILAAAETRIRRYMSGRGRFHQLDTRGVVDALWGRTQDENYRGRFDTPIKDQPQA